MPTTRYRALDPDKIVLTLATLERRIAERFPGSGLAGVAEELVAVARETHARVAKLSRPNYALRLLGLAIVVAGLAVLTWVSLGLKAVSAEAEIFNMVQGIDAGVNLLIVVGAAVFFLVTLEGRLRRAQLLEHLHELRAIIHVVDMHQLTKDPSALLGAGPRTAHSPERTMTPFLLTRYLDYCSELLSLAAKVAALHAQASTDTEVIDAVNDLERLTTNLSSKIWQKITLIEGAAAARPVAIVAPTA